MAYNKNDYHHCLVLSHENTQKHTKKEKFRVFLCVFVANQSSLLFKSSQGCGKSKSSVSSTRRGQANDAGNEAMPNSYSFIASSSENRADSENFLARGWASESSGPMIRSTTSEGKISAIGEAGT